MKQFHIIKEKIDNHPDNLWAKEVIIDKDELLIKSGAIEKNLHFVLEGSLVVLFTNEIEEYVIRFGHKNSFISSLDSFINETPSLFDIKAIKKCKLKVIRREHFMKSIKENQLEETWVKALSELVSQQVTREIDLITKTPLERYYRLLKRSPKIFQEIPQKYIASYLRMTPETLSRLIKS